MSEQPTRIAPAVAEVRVSEHPAAMRSIRRARGWGGVLGFLAALLLAWRAGLPAADALLRALAGGVVAHLLVWVCAVALWRRLVLAELDLAHARVRAAMERAEAEAAAAAMAAEAS